MRARTAAGRSVASWEQRGRPGPAAADADLAQALAELVGADRLAGLPAGEQPGRGAVVAEGRVAAAGCRHLQGEGVEGGGGKGQLAGAEFAQDPGCARLRPRSPLWPAVGQGPRWRVSRSWPRGRLPGSWRRHGHDFHLAWSAPSASLWQPGCRAASLAAAGWTGQTSGRAGCCRARRPVDDQGSQSGARRCAGRG